MGGFISLMVGAGAFVTSKYELVNHELKAGTFGHPVSKREPAAAGKHGGKGAKGHDALLGAGVHEDLKAQAEAAIHWVEPSVRVVATRFVGAVKGVQEKATVVSEALEENERLRLENANLRRWSQALRFECGSRSAETQTRELASVIGKETGAPVGRALASIRYTPPAHLLPSQLVVLGLTYFEAKEFEKSAVIFTFLTEMDGGEPQRTPRNFLLAGASWYRLDHYSLADNYFSKVLKLKSDADVLPYQAQARLWRALVANRLKSRDRTQYWLRELVDYHPLSTEAGWINPAAGDRVPSAAEILGKSRKRNHESRAGH